MKMQKRQFRIGQLAQHLNIEKFVIRFWEKEFEISSIRSDGGQRYYNEKDIEKFVMIKDLLYHKGFTIAGAKQQLKEKTKRKINDESKIIASQKTTLEPAGKPNTLTKDQLEQQIIDLQKKLLKLRELL